jgi:nucleoside-diphosphate-sugar epimerase
MNIAITGATGFIGRYSALALARAGHNIRVLTRPGRESAVSHPKDNGGSGEFEVFTGDLTDKDSLEGYMEDQDMLLHLASAHDHLPDGEMRAVTVAGSEALVNEAIRADKKRERIQMWIMSSAVIGAPVYSYYRDTKRIQEKIFKGSGFEWTSFRPTLVYGVGDYRHTATIMRKCAAQGGRMTIPHSGRSRINPVHVDDVVDCVLRKIGYDKQVDCIYELAGPTGITYNEFIDYTIAATCGTVRRRNIPKKWADFVIALKGVFKDVTDERRASAYFLLHHEHDITNARVELGWSPRTYEQGIKDCAAVSDWWKYETEEEALAAGVAVPVGQTATGA